MNSAKRQRNTRILKDKRSRFQLKVDSDCWRGKSQSSHATIQQGCPPCRHHEARTQEYYSEGLLLHWDWKW